MPPGNSPRFEIPNVGDTREHDGAIVSCVHVHSNTGDDDQGELVIDVDWRLPNGTLVDRQTWRF